MSDKAGHGGVSVLAGAPEPIGGAAGVEADGVGRSGLSGSGLARPWRVSNRPRGRDTEAFGLVGTISRMQAVPVTWPFPLAKSMTVIGPGRDRKGGVC